MGEMVSIWLIGGGLYGLAIALMLWTFQHIAEYDRQSEESFRRWQTEKMSYTSEDSECYNHSDKIGQG